VAGGDVTLGPATTIAGALTLSGGRVRFEGTAHDRLEVSGGSISLDGVVLGDAEVRAEQVEIGPNTRIDGKLIVHSSSEPVIPEGARIAGGVEFNPTSPATDDETQPAAAEGRSVAHGVGSFLWMLGVFIAGTLFTLAFPGYSQRAAAWIGREPLKSLALGFVLLFCLPVLVVLLLITIIGIPLALLVLLLYLLLLFLGWVTAALFLSHKLLGVMRGGQSVSTLWRLFALLLGVLGLWLLGQLPYVGGWVSFAALLLGIGALVWQGWPSRTSPVPPAAA
jgi:cytoskeletal protein CcmA (bactofilin family)